MNWKLLSLTVAVLGLSLIACDNKKEEKKADEPAPPTAVIEEKTEEKKADNVTPAETTQEAKDKDKKEEGKAL